MGLVLATRVNPSSLFLKAQLIPEVWRQPASGVEGREYARSLPVYALGPLSLQSSRPANASSSRGTRGSQRPGSAHRGSIAGPRFGTATESTGLSTHPQKRTWLSEPGSSCHLTRKTLPMRKTSSGKHDIPEEAKKVPQGGSLHRERERGNKKNTKVFQAYV